MSNAFNQLLVRSVGSIGVIITATWAIEFQKQSIWINLLLITFSVVVVVVIIFDCYDMYSERPVKFRRQTDDDKNKISKYLINEMKAAGSIAIFAKDLTWVAKGSEAESFLKTKAAKKELTLCLESEIDVALELRSLGAEIVTYGKYSKFSPKSRFTILDHRTGGTRVMIAVPANGEHLIKHYQDADKEVVDLAMDFISLLTCMPKRQATVSAVKNKVPVATRRGVSKSPNSTRARKSNRKGT